jgi:hypothetical protein
LSSINRSSLFLVTAAVIIIIFAIVITAEVQGPRQKAFSQIITVGPVWPTSTWSCTSDADFMVYGAIRGIHSSLYEVSISGLGTQSLYVLDDGKMGSFSIGSPAGHTMNIKETGEVTGFITLQTMSGAKASCVPT